MVFILGIWLWDHYFGKPAGYVPGTEEVALIRIDRDLRLAEQMADDPGWLKWLAGAEEPAAVKANSAAMLEKLITAHSIGLQGMEAYAVLKADIDRRPVHETMAAIMQGQIISEFDETSRRLVSHRGTWWHARLIEDWEKTTRPAEHWRQVFADDSRKIRSRAIFARSSVWLLGLVGLAFVPRTLRTLRRAFSEKPRGYGSAWTLPLGVVVFLSTILAWIGFTMTLELGIATLPNLHPAVAILLDSAARVLPSLIALGLLFRKPSHAVRVLGLNRRFVVPCILGMFALLTIIDQILRVTIGSGESEPGGGLSAGEAGLWGLAFAVVSACLLAPLAEEILYRGVLFGSLRNRLGLIPAAIASSVVFAVLHFYDGYGLASVGIFGLSCALLYAATGSLWSCIGLHMLYNSSIKIPEWIIYHGPLN